LNKIWLTGILTPVEAYFAFHVFVEERQGTKQVWGSLFGTRDAQQHLLNMTT
jgi:hypothetical protein